MCKVTKLRLSAQKVCEKYVHRGAAVAVKKVVNIASSSTTSLDSDDAFLISITENTSRGQRIVRPRNYNGDAAFQALSSIKSIRK